jgi:hypothetical protein
MTDLLPLFHNNLLLGGWKLVACAQLVVLEMTSENSPRDRYHCSNDMGNLMYNICDFKYKFLVLQHGKET